MIAVNGKEPNVVHDEYEVVRTGRREEIPESPVIGAMLPSGAYLLYVNDRTLPDDKVFSRLSENASLIACYANETVMNSYVTSWVNGSREWSVFHDAQQGLKHLETLGNIPDELAPIQTRLLAAQDANDDADYVFDIPVELFVSLGGVRYDRYLPNAGPEPWEILDRR